MKHLLYTLAILLIAASCSNEETEQVMGQGKARLQFHVSTESPVVITRSTPVPTVNQLYVKIQDSTGAVVTQDSLKTLQQNSPVFLEAAEGGTEYEVEVYSNELKDVILDKPCFFASGAYTLLPEETVLVKLECSLQQFQISFNASDAFKKVFRTDDKLQSGDTKFKLTVSDENKRQVSYALGDLDKSAYFDGAKSSSFIKIHIEGTTLEGFPVDYSNTILPKDGLLEKKDHLIIDLQVSETKSMMLKATPVE